MDIKLETDTIKAIVSEAVMASLTSEKREALIQNALNYLLTQKKDGYSNHPPESLLESAFKQALGTIAREISSEMLANDTRVREVVRKMIADAVEKLLDPTTYSETVERIKNAIEQGLSRR
ncbi:MAG TPA: hypothetical protein VNN25_27010 [Thermoanaerobaculia bacterium]|nr:hypothetical protein [Thermoanaerobaculia bacterium]